MAQRRRNRRPLLDADEKMILGTIAVVFVALIGMWIVNAVMSQS